MDDSIAIFYDDSIDMLWYFAIEMAFTHDVDGEFDEHGHEFDGEFWFDGYEFDGEFVEYGLEFDGEFWLDGHEFDGEFDIMMAINLINGYSHFLKPWQMVNFVMP